MSRSTTRPSIWWNTGMCVASGVSRRKTRPGVDHVDRRRLRLHRADLHRRRVRAQQRACRAARRRSRRTACRTCRAPDGRRGMLSASKLCQSVSTSGPSAIWKPRPTKTSSSRSHACVTRWAWPRARLAGELGEVEPLGLDAGRGGGVAQLRGARGDPWATFSIASFTAWPAVRFSSTVASPPSCVLSCASAPFLPSSRLSSTVTDSSESARSISASAASRAAAIWSITNGPFRSHVGTGRGSPDGLGACRSRASALPGRPPGAQKSQERHGRRA